MKKPIDRKVVIHGLQEFYSVSFTSFFPLPNSVTVMRPDSPFIPLSLPCQQTQRRAEVSQNGIFPS